jgi:hypothetical protein
VIDDLDLSVERLLQLELGAPLPFDLSFAIPDRNFAPVSTQRNTLNCYAYDIRENRELRTAAPYLEYLAGGLAQWRYPPARVQVSYCITAWSPAQVTPGTPPARDEHRLLADVLRVLLRYPELPNNALVGALIGQRPPLQTVVIQPDVSKIVDDFWSAIGGQLRPSLDYRVSLSLAYRDLVRGPMVTTQISTFGQLDVGGPTDERIQIGGRITDSTLAANPIANAWVRLDAAGITAVTGNDGRFVFQGVTRGAHVLSVRAVGFADATRAIQIPEPTGNYDISLN